jgi:dihydroorotate dehydrogenase
MLLRQRVRKYAYANGFGLGEEAERFVLNGTAGVPPGSLAAGRLLAVQIAKNKTTPDDDLDAVVKDYVYCVEHLGKYADILVVNVSSPNTPGLRSLQSQGPLTRILSAVVEAAQSTPRLSKPAVMVKVSPDEDSQEQVQGICDAVWAAGVDGVIVGNTTTKRPGAVPQGSVLPLKDILVLREQGGYSGPQLFEQTVSLIKKYRKLLDDGPKFDASDASAKGKALASKQKTIFASGGITNGAQALETLNAGASVAMVYTALVYGGVGTVSRIKEDMKKILREG